MAKRKAKLATYVLILAVAFLLLLAPVKFLNPVKFVIIRVAAVPIRAVYVMLYEFKKMLYYHRTFAAYMHLRKDNTTLRTRLMGMDELLRENSRLETLLDFKRNLLYSSVAAVVIGRDFSDWNMVIMIDRGRKDGISVGMPVISAMGVVGTIVEITDDDAKAMLLTDPGFSVAALVQRSREVGLVSGTLQGLSRMRYLSHDADIQVGDQVMTSKISSTFPEGLLIGEVIDIQESEESPAKECLIRPAVSLSQIEEVLVIQKNNP